MVVAALAGVFGGVKGGPGTFSKKGTARHFRRASLFQGIFHGGRGTGEVVGPLLTSDRCGVVFGCFRGRFIFSWAILVFVLVGGGLTR